MTQEEQVERLIKTHVWACGNWMSLGPTASNVCFLTQEEYAALPENGFAGGHPKHHFLHQDYWSTPFYPQERKKLAEIQVYGKSK